MKTKALILTLALPLFALKAAPEPEKDTTPIPVQDAAIARWREARFGMFIHWGPVSLTGHEIGWSRGNQTPIEEYDNLYKRFNPEKFNADEWVSIAKAAGMKYMVLTTKHHDGFCLWDTKQTDYNIMNSPFKRDVVKELAAACRKQGIGFGTYYSTCDWHHPDFPVTSPGGKTVRPESNLDRYTEYLKAQVKELLGYGPLFTLWFDVPQKFDAARGQGVINMARSIQPDIVINNRTGAKGDYDTPEQRIGKYQDSRPWETCMTICHQWAWKPNDEMKSLKQCIQTLVICAGGDGNLLFNVGPTPDGEIEQRQVERLKEMGEWLTKNSAAIYGTRGGPWKPTKTVAGTRNGSTIFVHILGQPDGKLALPDLPVKVKSAALLGGVAVKVEQGGGKLSIDLGGVQLDPIDTIVRLELDAPAMDIPAIALDSGVKASASNVFAKQNEQHGPQNAFDNEAGSRWATDAGTKQCWIAADFGKPMKCGRVHIEEAVEKRIQKFEVQYRDGDTWKTIFEGKTVGKGFQKSFPPVTAREFRLNILDATEGPTISEIEFIEN